MTSFFAFKLCLFVVLFLLIIEETGRRFGGGHGIVTSFIIQPRHVHHPTRRRCTITPTTRRLIGADRRRLQDNELLLSPQSHTWYDLRHDTAPSTSSSVTKLHARKISQPTDDNDDIDGTNSSSADAAADDTTTTIDADTDFEEEEVGYKEEEDEYYFDEDGNILLPSFEDDMMFFGDDGPDAFLDEADLALLHDISITDDYDVSSASSSQQATKKKNKKRLDPVNATSKTATIPRMNTASASAAGIPQNDVISLSELNELISSTKNVSYFYLRDELGLSEDTMWKITHEAGSVLGMTADTVRTKVNVLKQNMDLSNEELEQILFMQPTLLHLSARKNLAPKILFLVRQLDLGKEDLKHLVMGWPSTLTYSMNNLNLKIQFYKRSMRYTTEECRNLLCYKKPKLLCPSVTNGLFPRVKFLVNEMEFPIHNVKTICYENPNILLKSLDDNLRPKLIFYFILTLQMDNEEVLKMLLNYPHILEYNVENHLKPISSYLSSVLGFSGREISRMLLKYPRFMTYSLIKIKHVVGYLRYQLGLQPSDVRRILYQSPQLLGLTTKNLQSKVAFLQNATTPLLPTPTSSVATLATDPSSYDDKEEEEDSTTTTTMTTSAALRRVIVGMPTLLNLSVGSNLGPKVDYLRDKLGQEELSQSLQRLPTLLGYSLEKRIKPRLEAILNARVDGSALTVGIPMKQETFDAWLPRRAVKKKKKMKSKTASGGYDDNEEQQRVVEAGGRIVHWRRRDPLAP